MDAKGTFETAGWTPQPAYDERDGVALTHVTLTKTFTGDLEATGAVSMIMSTAEHEDSRSYVAMERIAGSLNGREGSFVVQHNAVSDQGEDSLRVTVVPGSGTGELAGLRGEMVIDAAHTYVFSYELRP